MHIDINMPMTGYGPIKPIKERKSLGRGVGGGMKWEGGRLANSYQSTHCTLLQRRLTHFRRTSTYRRLLGSKKREAIDVNAEREGREKTPADRWRHGERETRGTGAKGSRKGGSHSAGTERAVQEKSTRLLFNSRVGKDKV